MSKKVKAFISLIVLTPIAVVSNKVLAVSTLTPTSDLSLGDVINKVLSVILSIAGIIALFYIIFGGFTYLTSSGDPEKVGKATKMMTYAVIGVVIIAVSFALKAFIFNQLFGVNYGQGLTF